MYPFLFFSSRLEYKYQKLASSTSGELPAADSCAIDEDDDEDEVHFEDGNKKSRSFLSKFKSRGSSDKVGAFLKTCQEYCLAELKCVHC